MSYPEVIEYLGFGPRWAGCAAGKPTLPLTSFISPADWFVFPPALVPIASDGSGPGYLGLWAHWFLDRKPSFVTMKMERGRTVTEVARTQEQFLAYVLIKAIVENDGLTPDIDAFAAAMGPIDVDELDRASLATGDDSSKFSQIPVFQENCPLAACASPDLYDGEFPVIGATQRLAGAWSQMCSPFEVEPGARSRVAAAAQTAAWWKTSDQRRLFADCMSSKNYRGAWLSLNSSGWTVAEARDALTRLTAESRAPGLNLLCDAWCAMAVGPDLTY